MACFARPDAPNPPIRSDDWAAGETVTLRPRMAWGIESAAQMRALRLPAGTDLQSLAQDDAIALVQQNIDPTAVQQHKMELMVTGWTLLYDDGTPAPLNPEMIAALPKAYADFIAAEIERRGGALSAQETRGPLEMTSPARSASASPAPSSTGSEPTYSDA